MYINPVINYLSKKKKPLEDFLKNKKNVKFFHTKPIMLSMSNFSKLLCAISNKSTAVKKRKCISNSTIGHSEQINNASILSELNK